MTPIGIHQDHISGLSLSIDRYTIGSNIFYCDHRGADWPGLCRHKLLPDQVYGFCVGQVILISGVVVHTAAWIAELQSSSFGEITHCF